MTNRQAEIAAALDVVPPFSDEAALQAEVAKRKAFIKQCLRNAGLKVLVLGISLFQVGHALFGYLGR